MRRSSCLILAGAIGLLLGLITSRSLSQQRPDDAAVGKDATPLTVAANAEVLTKLPFDNLQDFDDARRGLIAPLPHGGLVRDAAGNPVWDPSRFNFISAGSVAPNTVHPSLWRQAQLLTISGLFKVAERIYQVRGYDLANITFIETDTGVVVVDPLLSVETARASLDLYQQYRPRRPVQAVIFTHCHADHFGGIKGVLADADESRVKLVAPEGFFDKVISENLMAGNAMSRRATYMYGNVLPRDPRGMVTAGLGMTTSSGTVSLKAPTEFIRTTGQELTIDGLKFVFQLTPGTEAPAEMHFYLPQLRALCTAENAVHNLHNVYTLRGAEIRDARAWSRGLGEAVDLFAGQSDVLFGVHHWPVWGTQQIVDHLKKQRDAYKYLHDQTLRLANHGHTMNEIAEMVQLPESLAKEWHLRGYYGSVSHNVKAIYVKYLGWFDGNPATLNPLPPVETSTRYVEMMGGPEAVLSKARESFAKGDYRWVAQLVNHVVLADPRNAEARNLKADTLEQLGYQSENAVWRNFYLSAARELREGVRKAPAPTNISPDAVTAMHLEMIFDFIGVRLNGPKAAGKRLTIAMNFTDVKQKYTLLVENGVLNYTDKPVDHVDATVTWTRTTLNEILLGQAKLIQKVTTGDIKVEGNIKALQEFLTLLDAFEFWFNIVTPNAKT